MKKLLMWLVLGVMALSTVSFTLGCPKPTDPAQELTPAPEAGEPVEDVGDEEGGE